MSRYDPGLCCVFGDKNTCWTKEVLPSDDVKRFKDKTLRVRVCVCARICRAVSGSEEVRTLDLFAAVRLKLAVNKRGGINWAQPLAGENPPQAVGPDAALSS